MHLVPAPAVRLMKRRVQSRPGARQENRFTPGKGWDTSLFIESLTVGLRPTAGAGDVCLDVGRLLPPVFLSPGLGWSIN